jgi:sulfur carrier protein
VGIRVNNKEYEFVEDETVSELLKRLNFKFPLIIVTIDGNLIPREMYPETGVPNQAEISVIHLISGG